MIRFLCAFFFSISASVAVAEIDIQEVETPSGVKVWLVEEPSIPFVALEILFKGGTSLDVEGKRGATNLMMALLEEGAGDLDAQAFQAQREALAASYEFGSYDDSVSVSARFLSENRDEAVELLRSAINDPRFDQQALDRVRSQVLANIASSEKNPNRIASRAFYSAAFGDHPYGTDDSGTVESVAALTAEDMFEAHENALVRSRAYVSVVGDISADEVGALIDRLIGDLPETGPDFPEPVEFGLAGGTTVIPYQTPQSVALFGHSGIERDDPDFFAAYILNTILGGNGPQSVLMDEVREKRGLTYGVYSYLVSKDYSTMMLGSVASGNERMAETISVIKEVWNDFYENGVSADQLDRAKTYLTGEYPLRFSSNAKIANILVGMQIEGIPRDYVVNRNDYINAVTLDDISRVARELLAPEDLHFVVVGQPEGLEKQDG